jgi:hypothetical protein
MVLRQRDDVTSAFSCNAQKNICVEVELVMRILQLAIFKCVILIEKFEMLKAAIDIPNTGVAVARQSPPEGRLVAMLFPYGYCNIRDAISMHSLTDGDTVPSCRG